MEGLKTYNLFINDPYMHSYQNWTRLAGTEETDQNMLQNDPNRNEW